MQRPIIKTISAAVIAAIATGAHAGSFSLYTEGSGRAIGNYAAGVAAEASDASTGWYNPAGLALLNTQQAVFGGVGVFPSSKLSGTTTYSTTGIPVPYTQSYSNLQGAKDAFVPSFHYAKPLSENITAGLSVVSPFGLSTDWSRTSAVRYSATYSELITTDLAPELGAKITDNFAIGAGLDLQYARVKFNKVIGAPDVMRLLGQNPASLDSYSYNKGDSFGVGFHAGLMTMFNDNHTRVGFNYQSKMKHKFHGYSRLSGSLATANVITYTQYPLTSPTSSFRTNTLYSNDIEFPEIATLSGYHDLNDQWALLGSVVYTGWHSLSYIQLNNAAAFAPTVGRVLANSRAVQNYDNAWRFAVGANYKVDEQWMLRVGGGYDQSPTNDVDRDIRIADSDRWALSAGAHYQYREDIGLDLGYTHLFSVDSSVPLRKVEGTAANTVTLNGSAKGSADLVGVQATWYMDGIVKPVPTK
ncbi:OmpP1/FadL family transporter [Legionella dresdenensis]|uniref:OmpP1/FadL family transporter n=1 Tax=Legionella dresdenensis TaxID=450200 RepID=A0ABV8CHZ9_9GAMM